MRKGCHPGTRLLHEVKRMPENCVRVIVVVPVCLKSSTGLPRSQIYREDARQQALIEIALVKLLGGVYVLGDREIAEGDLVRTDADDRAVSGKKRVDGFALLESKGV